MTVLWQEGNDVMGGLWSKGWGSLAWGEVVACHLISPFHPPLKKCYSVRQKSACFVACPATG